MKEAKSAETIAKPEELSKLKRELEEAHARIHALKSEGVMVNGADPMKFESEARSRRAALELRLEEAQQEEARLMIRLQNIQAEGDSSPTNHSHAQKQLGLIQSQLTSQKAEVCVSCKNCAR